MLAGSALEEFNVVAQKNFREQGIAFLNAYWNEVEDQADFIFEVAYAHFRMADMHINGVTLIHLYDEGTKLNEMASLYFYEKLCRFTLESKEGAKWRTDRYLPSRPEMLTSIKRKQQLKKVDLNYDGHLSFLEYLIEQYADLEDPEDFLKRNRKFGGERSKEMIRAEDDLEAVMARIREYEERKAALEEKVRIAEESGSNAKLRIAERELAKLILSPLGNELRVALLQAEASVRVAAKKMRREAQKKQGTDSPLPAGSLFWMQREVEVNKKLYGQPGGK